MNKTTKAETSTIEEFTTKLADVIRREFIGFTSLDGEKIVFRLVGGKEFTIKIED